MKYLDIPGTQLHISQICLGSTEFGASISATESDALLDEFVALGGNFIDSACIFELHPKYVKYQ